MVCACVKEKHGVDSFDYMFQKEAWSFKIVFYGIHPSVDFNSNPWKFGTQEFKDVGKQLFVDGKIVNVHLVTADTDAFSNDLRCAHHGSKVPCGDCKLGSDKLDHLKKPLQRDTLCMTE